MKALFAGTFDPFTLGHKSIADRTLQIADQLVIAVGVNPDKSGLFSVEDRIAQISELYKENPRVEVTSYKGLTTDFADEIGANVLVRGVRSVKDFEYERQIADINRQLTGIETILLFTEERYSSISSSVVRELISYGKDVSCFLP